MHSPCSKTRIVFSACMLAFTGAMFGADDAALSELAKLRAALADQQQQMDRLRAVMEEQRKMIDGMLGAAHSAPAKAAAADAPAPSPSPLSLQIGSSYFTPVGFMDFTGLFRSTVSGSGIGTNFGSIPYSRGATLPAVNGHLSETRLSMQNSRLGGRFDSKFKGVNMLAYFEMDFLGNNPGNVAVSSNSNTFRSRVYFVDLQKKNWEFLAGQTWSLITPNRKGISPIPGNLFYSQDIDVNYQAGLVWGRIPEIRAVYHSNDGKFHLAIAADQQEQYVGGSAGAGIVVPPTALAGTEFAGFNNGTQTVGTPNLAPDIIVKAAWDPSAKFHAEVVGMETNFKGFNPANNSHYTKTGGGVSLNANFEIFKGFRLLTNNYWSDGGGRYIFGQAPGAVLKANGDIGLIHSGSTVSGFEYTHKNTLIYGYYGGIYIGRYTVLDTNNSRVGYGYVGSANSQNRVINEATFGFNQTLWKDAKHGAVNFMGQYSYLTRSPWYAAPGTPGNAAQNQLYLNLRYTLPGAPPTIK